MSQKVEILSSEYISDHPYFKAKKDAYRLSSGKIVDPYYYVELPPCVIAMGITQENKVLLVKQYRHPLGESNWELAGGFIDSNENPDDAIKREMLEETGYSFSAYYRLGITAANPGILSNKTYMYLATGGKKTAEQKLDANEEIDFQEFSREEVDRMIMEDKIPQSMHALCILLAEKKLNELKLF